MAHPLPYSENDEFLVSSVRGCETVAALKGTEDWWPDGRVRLGTLLSGEGNKMLL